LSPKPITKEEQLVVRLEKELVQRLDKAASDLGSSRSQIVREAVQRYLADEVGEREPAIRGAYQRAVVKAFDDEGQLWAPMSIAEFYDYHPAIAKNTTGSTHVEVTRPGFIASGQFPPGVIPEDINWKENVSTPKELYKALRAYLAGLAQERLRASR